MSAPLHYVGRRNARQPHQQMFAGCAAAAVASAARSLTERARGFSHALGLVGHDGPLGQAARTTARRVHSGPGEEPAAARLRSTMKIFTILASSE